MNSQDNWRVGGNLGLSFGSNDYFGFGISPFVGYQFTKNIEGGVTIGYQYAKWKEYKQNLFSVGPYLNYYPVDFLFIRVHYEYYTGNEKYRNTSVKRAFDENALWIGGGYSSNSGPVRFYVGLMYDLLYKSDSSVFSSGLRPIAGVSISI